MQKHVESKTAAADEDGGITRVLGGTMATQSAPDIRGQVMKLRQIAQDNVSALESRTKSLSDAFFEVFTPEAVEAAETYREDTAMMLHTMFVSMHLQGSPHKAINELLDRISPRSPGESIPSPPVFLRLTGAPRDSEKILHHYGYSVLTVPGSHHVFAVKEMRENAWSEVTYKEFSESTPDGSRSLHLLMVRFMDGESIVNVYSLFLDPVLDTVVDSLLVLGALEWIADDFSPDDYPRILPIVQKIMITAPTRMIVMLDVMRNMEPSVETLYGTEGKFDRVTRTPRSPKETIAFLIDKGFLPEERYSLSDAPADLLNPVIFFNDDMQPEFLGKSLLIQDRALNPKIDKNLGARRGNQVLIPTLSKITTVREDIGINAVYLSCYPGAFFYEVDLSPALFGTIEESSRFLVKYSQLPVVSGVALGRGELMPLPTDVSTATTKRRYIAGETSVEESICEKFFKGVRGLSLDALGRSGEFTNFYSFWKRILETFSIGDSTGLISIVNLNYTYEWARQLVLRSQTVVQAFEDIQVINGAQMPLPFMKVRHVLDLYQSALARAYDLIRYQTPSMDEAFRAIKMLHDVATSRRIAGLDSVWTISPIPSGAKPSPSKSLLTTEEKVLSPKTTTPRALASTTQAPAATKTPTAPQQSGTSTSASFSTPSVFGTSTKTGVFDPSGSGSSFPTILPFLSTTPTAASGSSTLRSALPTMTTPTPSIIQTPLPPPPTSSTLPPLSTLPPQPPPSPPSPLTAQSLPPAPSLIAISPKVPTPPGASGPLRPKPTSLPPLPRFAMKPASVAPKRTGSSSPSPSVRRSEQDSPRSPTIFLDEPTSSPESYGGRRVESADPAIEMAVLQTAQEREAAERRAEELRKETVLLQRAREEEMRLLQELEQEREALQEVLKKHQKPDKLIREEEKHRENLAASAKRRATLRPRVARASKELAQAKEWGEQLVVNVVPGKIWGAALTKRNTIAEMAIAIDYSMEKQLDAKEAAEREAEEGLKAAESVLDVTTQAHQKLVAEILGKKDPADPNVLTGIKGHNARVARKPRIDSEIQSLAESIEKIGGDIGKVEKEYEALQKTIGDYERRIQELAAEAIERGQSLERRETELTRLEGLPEKKWELEEELAEKLGSSKRVLEEERSELLKAERDRDDLVQRIQEAKQEVDRLKTTLKELENSREAPGIDGPLRTLEQNLENAKKVVRKLDGSRLGYEERIRALQGSIAAHLIAIGTLGTQGEKVEAIWRVVKEMNEVAEDAVRDYEGAVERIRGSIIEDKAKVNDAPRLQAEMKQLADEKRQHARTVDKWLKEARKTLKDLENKMMGLKNEKGKLAQEGSDFLDLLGSKTQATKEFNEAWAGVRKATAELDTAKKEAENFRRVARQNRETSGKELERADSILGRIFLTLTKLFGDPKASERFGLVPVFWKTYEETNTDLEELQRRVENQEEYLLLDKWTEISEGLGKLSSISRDITEATERLNERFKDLDGIYTKVYAFVTKVVTSIGTPGATRVAPKATTPSAAG